MATGLFSSKTNRRTTAVAKLLSHSTTWRTIDIKNYIVGLEQTTSGLFLSAVY